MLMQGSGKGRRTRHTGRLDAVVFCAGVGDLHLHRGGRGVSTDVFNNARGLPRPVRAFAAGPQRLLGGSPADAAQTPQPVARHQTAGRSA